MTELLAYSLPAWAADPFNERNVVYALVFAAACCLPLIFWHREAFVDNSVPAGDWSRLPGLFKVLWKPAYILETSIGELFARLMPATARRYAELAEISNLPLTGRRVFVCKTICFLASIALGAALFLLPPTVPKVVEQVFAVIVVAIGWTLPSMALAGAAQKRQEEIVKSLPFAIDLIGSAMHSGLEFGAAMRYYVNSSGQGALEEEFSRVLRDSVLGVSISDGLQTMAKRVRIKSFTSFAGVVAYGTDIGASIADTLKVHGAEMRRERFNIAEQKAARAPALMIFPIALFILPAVFLIIIVPVMLQFKAAQGM